MEPHLNPQLLRHTSAYTRVAETTRPAPKQSGPPPPKIQQTDQRPSLSRVYSATGDLRITPQRNGSLLASYRQTRAAISEQVSVLNQKYQISNDSSNEVETGATVAPSTVGERRSLADLSDYYNRENTARRIFDIATLGYQIGADKDDFATKAIALVKQAYDDVGSVLGIDFPDVVVETKETVIRALEQFRNGVEFSKIEF